MVTLFILGQTSTGKTTLSKRLAQRFKVERISSDEVRESMRKSHNGKPTGLHVFGEPTGLQVFGEMERVIRDFADMMQPLIVDTTGMSFRVRRLLEAAENPFVIILEASRSVREYREEARTDREALPAEAMSQCIHPPVGRFMAPARRIDTSHRSPDMVYEMAYASLPPSVMADLNPKKANL